MISQCNWYTTSDDNDVFWKFYVGTSISNIYRFNHVSDFKPQLMNTSHSEAINDVAFAL